MQREMRVTVIVLLRANRLNSVASRESSALSSLPISAVVSTLPSQKHIKLTEEKLKYI